MNTYYNTLDTFLKKNFGEKCYKIAIDAGLTCPNRDGKVGLFGCSFCSAGGSGDFAVSRKAGTIQEQIEAGLSLFGEKRTGRRYIAYYQAYTNTYGDISYLEQIYREALEHPDIIGISIATRPDCLGPDILSLLNCLRLEYAPKFIWIELGLQTCHDETARHFGRGYPTSVFEQAMDALATIQIPVVIHVILGLPGEIPKMMYETIRYVNRFNPFGIKLQLLHILRDTGLATEYGIENPRDVCGDFYPVDGRKPLLHLFSLDEYLSVLIHCLELLAPDIVIHRVTGDGPKDLLLAPLWSRNKRNVLNTLHRTMKLRLSYQGRLFDDAGSVDFI